MYQVKSISMWRGKSYDDIGLSVLLASPEGVEFRNIPEGVSPEKLETLSAGVSDLTRSGFPEGLYLRPFTFNVKSQPVGWSLVSKRDYNHQPVFETLLIAAGLEHLLAPLPALF